MAHRFFSAPRRFVWIGAIHDLNPYKKAGKNNRDDIATFKHILSEHSPMLPPRQSSYLVIPAQAGIQQFPIKGSHRTSSFRRRPESSNFPSKDTGIQIHPFRIIPLDKFQFPIPLPFLYGLFATNGRFHGFVVLKLRRGYARRIFG